MIRILFLLRSLNYGGVERQLIELVKNMNHGRFLIHVITFYDGGVIRKALADIPSVMISSVGKKGRWDLLSFFIRLFMLVKNFRPDVIQTYLDVPNSFGLVVGRLTGSKVSLGASASYIDFSRYDWTRYWVYKAGAFLSRFSDAVIANSFVGRTYNIDLGYSAEKMMVIPNGIDTGVFVPDRLAGEKMRAMWGIGKNEKVIGIVGRMDPMKDHQNFLMAAKLVTQKMKDCRFVCIGRGHSDYVQELKKLSTSLLPSEQVLWIHDCEDDDLPGAYNAFDVLVSSSYGEGLPVVIGEGMACGIPCVATDVGDSALAIGEAGITVPAKDPAALAEAICAIISKPADEYQFLCTLARKRVEEEYSIEKMASGYEAVYESLAKI